jgi:hypothetical protein
MKSKIAKPAKTLKTKATAETAAKASTVTTAKLTTTPTLTTMKAPATSATKVTTAPTMPATKAKREDRRIKFARMPREDEACTPQERLILEAVPKRGTCTEAELVEDLVKAKFPTRSTPAVIHRYYKHRTLLANGWIAEA